MNVAKGFSTPTIKVSEMREMIKNGQYTKWVKSISAARKMSIIAALHFIEAENILKKSNESAQRSLT